MCKWLKDGVCTNSDCDMCADFPYPLSICEDEWACGCYEEE